MLWSLDMEVNFQKHVIVYGNSQLEIVNEFTYLGNLLTTGGSFSEGQATLSGRAQKAIFILNFPHSPINFI